MVRAEQAKDLQIEFSSNRKSLKYFLNSSSHFLPIEAIMQLNFCANSHEIGMDNKFHCRSKLFLDKRNSKSKIRLKFYWRMRNEASKEGKKKVRLYLRDISISY